MYFILSDIVKRFFRESLFRKGLLFLYFLFVMMGFEFAPARGGHVSVSDQVITSQDDIKVEHIRT